MPPPFEQPRIGQLRWPVVIAQRAQTADTTTGIEESYRDIQEVRADIQPIDALTYYAGVQVDTPATHTVTIRWLDWLDTTHVIKRRTIRPDSTVREELFRVRRVREIEGRKRFAELECELEKRT